jgi:hypothetical protein
MAPPKPVAARPAIAPAAHAAAMDALRATFSLPPEPSCWFIYWDACGLSCYIFGVFTVLFVNAVTLSRVLWPWFRGSPWGIVHSALFQISCLMIYWCYLAAATTDPGTVTRGSASEGDSVPPQEDAERMFKPQRKFCKTCECIKPSRAHHCKTCNRCVMKMGA